MESHTRLDLMKECILQEKIYGIMGPIDHITTQNLPLDGVLKWYTKNLVEALTQKVRMGFHPSEHDKSH